jgi:hypothetical protein
VSGDTTRSATLDELEWVVNDGDPQYLPARFLYGVANLEEGRLEQAAAILSSLIEPIERHNETVVNEIAANWIEKRPRHPRIARKLSRFKYFKYWLDFWLRVTHHLYGGDYYRHAVNWQATKQAYQELQEREANPLGRDFARASFESHLNLFRGEPVLVEKTEAAFKRRPPPMKKPPSR